MHGTPQVRCAEAVVLAVLRSSEEAAAARMHASRLQPPHPTGPAPLPRGARPPGAGAGLLGLDLPFPVLLLDEAAAASARQRAAYNADQVGLGGE